jgi:hypothetical protein
MLCIAAVSFGVSGWLHGTIFNGVVIPQTDDCLCSFLATAEALYPVEHSAESRCSFYRLQGTDEYLMV